MHISYKNRLLRQLKVTQPLAAIFYNRFTYPWRFTRVHAQREYVNNWNVYDTWFYGVYKAAGLHSVLGTVVSTIEVSTFVVSTIYPKGSVRISLKD